MSKPPGRPKSDDPKLPVTIRVRSSIMASFADANAARAEIEALVEARYSRGRASLVIAEGSTELQIGDTVSTPGQPARRVISQTTTPHVNRLKGVWKPK